VDICDYRLISLCNVIYKLVTKTIMNQFKSILPRIISRCQSAFTPGRLISDDILVAYEIFHSMHCYSGDHRSTTIKLDMSKAYDRVEWDFLRAVMLKLGLMRIRLLWSCTLSKWHPSLSLQMVSHEVM